MHDLHAYFIGEHMNIGERLNRKGDKILYFYGYGRGKGQRPSRGLFKYIKPKNAAQRQHNVETKILVEVKKGQTILEQQAIQQVNQLQNDHILRNDGS